MVRCLSAVAALGAVRRIEIEGSRVEIKDAIDVFEDSFVLDQAEAQASCLKYWDPLR